MFDEITLGYSNLIHLSEFLPNNTKVRQNFVASNYFQSKSIASVMDIFFLGDDQKLYITERGFSFEEDDIKSIKEPYTWTGEIVFYTSYTIKREYWCDFILKVKDGNFDIKKVKFFKNVMF